MIGKPIETKYRGIHFRSRLEATWAAFFDQLSWRWEYEPIDFNGWFPDFRLFGSDDIFVEIKPIIAFDFDTSMRMQRAAPHNAELLLLGQCPELHSPQHLGWLRDAPPDDVVWDDLEGEWDAAIVGQFNPAGQIGFCHENGSYHDRISGAYDGNWPEPIDIQGCWGKAKIATRFLHRKG